LRQAAKYYFRFGNNGADSRLFLQKRLQILEAVVHQPAVVVFFR
jgi:hypothetical protein